MYDFLYISFQSIDKNIMIKNVSEWSIVNLRIVYYLNDLLFNRCCTLYIYMILCILALLGDSLAVTYAC